MNASFVRKIAQITPLPGGIIRRFLDRYGDTLVYPDTPVVISPKGRFGRFEIRNCQEVVQRNIYFLGYHELRESRLVRNLLRPGDTFLDIGANIGWFTVLAAHRVGPSGRVIAFEPSGWIFEHLQRNIALNGFAHVELRNEALSDTTGTAVLSGMTRQHTGVGSIVFAAEGDLPAEAVPTVRFDDFYTQAGLGTIRLMKIDVEGAEMKVLAGMRETLDRRACEYIVLEVNDRCLRQAGSSSAGLLDSLRQRGYRLFHIGLFGTTPLAANETVELANLLVKMTP